MYIVVIGGGRVGYYLTRALLEQGHEVLVIEKNATVCEIINEELGSICIRGDGCEISTLAEAGTERADMLVAVTGDDEDNLVSCQVAKQKFNVPKTISRIRNPKNETLFKKLGIDITISSTNLLMEAIEEAVPTHPLTHLMTVREISPHMQQPSANFSKN
jgi:trk system potassium uptake protein TrkA